MKRIGHRICLLLSSVGVKSFVNASGCLFVWQENESRVFCLSPLGWIVWIGAADGELRPFKFCAKIWSARGGDLIFNGTVFCECFMSAVLSCGKSLAFCQRFSIHLKAGIASSFFSTTDDTKRISFLWKIKISFLNLKFFAIQKEKLFEVSAVVESLFLEKALFACKTHPCGVTGSLLTNTYGHVRKSKFPRRPFWNWTKNKISSRFSNRRCHFEIALLNLIGGIFSCGWNDFRHYITVRARFQGSISPVVAH